MYGTLKTSAKYVQKIMGKEYVTISSESKIMKAHSNSERINSRLLES